MSEKILINVDPDLEDLIPGFLENRQNDVERLGRLLEAGEFAEIRLIGHSMKGVGGGYGFDEITAIGGDIERAALAGEHHSIVELTARLAEYLACIEVVFGD